MKKIQIRIGSYCFALGCLLFFFKTITVNAQEDSNTIFYAEYETWNLIVQTPNNGYSRNINGYELVIGRYLNSEEKVEVSITYDNYLNNESVQTLYKLHTKDSIFNNGETQDTLYQDGNKKVLLKYSDHSSKNFIEGIFVIGLNCYYIKNNSNILINNSLDTVINIIHDISNYKDETIEEIMYKNSYKDILKNLFESQKSIDSYLLSEKAIKSMKKISLYKDYKENKKDFLYLIEQNNLIIRNNYSKLSSFGTPKSIIFQINQDMTLYEGLGFTGIIELLYQNNSIKIKTAFLIIENNLYFINFKVIE